MITEAAGCANGIVRTDYQEISVSRPKAVSAAELNTPIATAMAFDFTGDAIPVNATDLILQVVYRGQLGAETDGVAVDGIDINEPSYLTYWNNSDYAGCNGQWVTTLSTACGGPAVGAVPDPSFICAGSVAAVGQDVS